jgi:hypothetical protein
MTRSWRSALGAGLVAGVLLCACGRGGGDHRNASEAPRVTKNPSDFPLYPRSEVVNVVPVDSAQMFAALRANDPRSRLPQNFRGHVIIAETGATMPQLRTWVAGLESAPPHGFHDTTTHTTRSATRGSRSSRGDGSGADINGDDVIQFENADGSRWVYLFAADPRQIYREMSPIFTMIDGYAAAPDFLRGPIDDAAKKQTGYTVMQMLDPKSPVGAVIAEVKRLHSSDRRAILLIDEAKAK